MKKYNKLCEMGMGELMNSIMSQTKSSDSDGAETQGSCNVQNPIQPDDKVGEFGNSTDIQIKVAQDGGLEIDSKEMAVKLSSAVFEAIKTFLNKGDE